MPGGGNAGGIRPNQPSASPFKDSGHV
jgi:hypothetical protein